MGLFYKFIRGSFKVYFKVLYRHQVHGVAHIPKGGAIIAPNHISYFDPPLIGLSCPEEVHYLARDTLFRQPLLGLIIRNLNAFPVSGKASDLKSIKAICELVASGDKVIIFPEGLRTFDGKLTRVKPGIAMIASRVNCPILPTFIHGTFEIWPRTKMIPRLRGRTICVFGTPIYPDSFEGMSKKEKQDAISQTIKERIEALREWFYAGCNGSPP